MSAKSNLRRKVRGSYAISTVSIALVLFLVASVGYIIWNLSKATDNIKERMTLYVMMEDGCPEEVVEQTEFMSFIGYTRCQALYVSHWFFPIVLDVRNLILNLKMQELEL